MSTKIHNGYRFAGLGPDPGVTTVLARVHAARTAVFGVVEDLALRYALDEVHHRRDRQAAGLVDESSVAETPVLSEVFECVRALARTAKAETFNASETALDLRCELVVLPSPDTGDALAMLFCGDARVEAAAADALGLVEFPYWNNSDPPDGMDDASWRARGALWDAALARSPTSGSPADNGLSFSLGAVDRVFPYRDRLWQRRPTFERRLEWLVESVYVDERINALYGEQRIQTDPPAPPEVHEIMRAFGAARDEIRDDRAADCLADLRARFTPLLPAEHLPTDQSD